MLQTVESTFSSIVLVVESFAMTKKKFYVVETCHLIQKVRQGAQSMKLLA